MHTMVNIQSTYCYQCCAKIKKYLWLKSQGKVLDFTYIPCVYCMHIILKIEVNSKNQEYTYMYYV